MPSIREHGKALFSAMGAKEAKPHLKALREKESRLSINTLVQLGLNNMNVDIQNATIKELGKLKTPKAIEALVEFGLNTKSMNSNQAIISLIDIGGQKVVDALVEKGLKSDDYPTAYNAITALGAISSNSSKEALLEHGVKSPSEQLRYRVIRKLGEAKYKLGVDDIVEYGLKSNSPMLAKESAQVLGEIGGSKVISPLVEFGLGSKYYGTRDHTYSVLKALGEPVTNALVEIGLTHENDYTILKSIDLLTEMETKKSKVIDALVKNCLNHDNFKIVESAVFALKTLQNKRALPGLMALSGHENKKLDKAVKEAIKAIQEANDAKR